MRLKTITVEKNMLRFLSGRSVQRPGDPAGEDPRCTRNAASDCAGRAGFTDGVAACERFAAGHDRALSRFFCRQGDTALEGVRYVTDFAPDVPENVYPTRNRTPSKPWSAL